jgi:hypothetical protein
MSGRRGRFCDRVKAIKPRSGPRELPVVERGADKQNRPSPIYSTMWNYPAVGVVAERIREAYRQTSKNFGGSVTQAGRYESQ